MATGSTNHTAIHGPDDNAFGILGSNIIIRLVVYYVVVAIVGIVAWKYLPTSFKDLLYSATQPLVGLSNAPPTGFMTPDPVVDARPPLAAGVLAVIASGAANVMSVPVSVVYRLLRH